MEAILTYLLKSSGLIAVFYLAYHFLVRKETFFNSNRWFLLSGLFTSLLLPLFIIKKIILVERPKISPEDLVTYSQVATKTIQDIPVVEAFDWMHFIWISYIIVASVLVLKIVFNFTSLYRMLYQQQVIKKENFKLVNLNENIAPFSFFNYIVYNSDLYSNEELQSILLHEKIHSQEKHSLDILIAKLFCTMFWFNPFVWLYKKAITQNLEYIADQKAISQLEDKKSYQRALLKVVSNQSCLSITNNFYQSLIKKRIVMLNKNQSHKRNSWKYAVIIPALIGFVFLFQIKLIAQEKDETTFSKRVQTGNEVRVVVTKNSSDAEMKNDVNTLNRTYGITLKYSKVKRNSAGEITGIKVEFKDKDGTKGVSQVDGKEPIKPIHFYKNDSGIGFGKPKEVRIFTKTKGGQNDTAPTEMAIDDSINVAGNFNFDFDMDFEAPEPPEAPEAPLPEHIWNDTDVQTKVVVKKDGKQSLVILNGKIVEGDQSILSKKELDELLDASSKDNSYTMTDTKVVVNDKNLMINAKRQMEIAKDQTKAQREQAQAQREQVLAQRNQKQAQLDQAKAQQDQMKAEMTRVKEEMIKAKGEMQAAKAEYEKAKAELKSNKK